MNKLVDSLPASSHLGAMLDASEEQTELYIKIQRRSTAAGNNAEPQELPVQPAVLAGRAAVRRMRA